MEIVGIVLLLLILIAVASPRGEGAVGGGLRTGNTSDPPPPPLPRSVGCFDPFGKSVEVGDVPPEPHRPIGETVLKKGGVAENFIRPKPIDAKPGDIIVVGPLSKTENK